MSKLLKIFMVLMLVTACSKKEEETNADYNLVIHTQNGEVKYMVEEALTREQMQKGLMFRDSLAKNGGMIFDLSGVAEPVSMWMKNTKIPLDMVFINSNGEVVWVYENAIPYSEELITAPVKVSAVLEINAGDVSAKGIKVGNMVENSLFAKKADGAVVGDDIVTVVDETTDTNEPEAEEIDESIVDDGSSEETIVE